MWKAYHRSDCKQTVTYEPPRDRTHGVNLRFKPLCPSLLIGGSGSSNTTAQYVGPPPGNGPVRPDASIESQPCLDTARRLGTSNSGNNSGLAAAHPCLFDLRSKPPSTLTAGNEKSSAKGLLQEARRQYQSRLPHEYSAKQKQFTH